MSGRAARHGQDATHTANHCRCFPVLAEAYQRHSNGGFSVGRERRLFARPGLTYAGNACVCLYECCFFSRFRWVQLTVVAVPRTDASRSDRELQQCTRLLNQICLFSASTRVQLPNGDWEVGLLSVGRLRNNSALFMLLRHSLWSCSGLLHPLIQTVK